MVIKNKLLMIKTYPRKLREDRNSSEALELPSSWTAPALNEKFWMRKAGIYSESFYLGFEVDKIVTRNGGFELWPFKNKICNLKFILKLLTWNT